MVLSIAAVWPLKEAAAVGFRASVVKVDITPDTSQWLLGYGPRQSAGVHDRIYHRIVAMDDGTTQFFLISSELCLFSPAIYDEVAHELEKQMGIKPLQVWWTVSHTHAAPESLGRQAWEGSSWVSVSNLEHDGRVFWLA